MLDNQQRPSQFGQAPSQPFNQNAYSQFGSNYSPQGGAMGAGTPNPEDGFSGARPQQGAIQAWRSYTPGQMSGASPQPSAASHAYQPATGGHAQPPAPTPTPQMPTSGMTWTQMQQQGYARPPFPMGSSGAQPSIPPGIEYPIGGQPNPAIPPGVEYPVGGQSSAGASPLSLEQRLTQAYSGYQGLPSFQNPVAGSGIDTATQQGVQSLLQNPSPYLTPAYQSQLDKTMGQIDDQYNQADLALHQNIASRGLDTAGTIGASDQRYNNLMRRSAKTDAATNLLNQLAQTYSGDRVNALNAALGYSGQQYGQAANTYGVNQGANAQNFGQRQTALENLLNYGQQGFNNQLQTAQFNAGQDQMNTQLLLQLLGAGY